MKHTPTPWEVHNSGAICGLTYSDKRKCWLTHRELGADVYTVPEALRKMYSARKLRLALSLWYVWEWCIGEFNKEWTEGRRVF